jgi:hypothetical protein
MLVNMLASKSVREICLYSIKSTLKLEIGSLALPFTLCVSLDKLLKLSEPQLSSSEQLLVQDYCTA